MTCRTVLSALGLLPLLGSPLRAQPRPVPVPAAPPATRAELVARLDSLSRAFLAAGPSVGAQVAVVRGGDTLLLRAYGLADREKRRAATLDQQFRIGSLTKQFTAAAIMRLAERGKLSLDDDLSRWVSEFPLQGHRVTLRQLLNHTSGIHSYTESEAEHARSADDLTPLQVVGFVARDTFDFPPGTQWSYTNTGYALLGLVIERASGEPYAEYVRHELAAPLGLRHTSYCQSRPTGAGSVRGYAAHDDGTTVPAQFLSMTHPYAAGGLCSTAGDLLAWQRALAGGRVVSPASYARMTTPDTLSSGERLTYGYGLNVGQNHGHRMVMHDGAVNGFNSSLLRVPDDSLDVVVLSNTEPSGSARLAQNLVRAVLRMPLMPQRPDGPPPMPPVAAVEPAVRDAAVGTYDLMRPTNGGTLVVHVVRVGEGLVVQRDAEGLLPIPLMPLGDGVFGSPVDPAMRMTFERGADGRVVGATVLWRGATFKGVRRP